MIVVQKTALMIAVQKTALIEIAMIIDKVWI